MSVDVLQHRGVVAVCFSCGSEKGRVFTTCSKCAAQPRDDDELLDSLVLSRYATSELLLSRAVAERSPGVVIKEANRSTMRLVSHALRDPQLRTLLGVPKLKPKQGTAETVCSSELWVEKMVAAAEREIAGKTLPSLGACLESQQSLSDWARTEQLLQGLRAEAATVSVEVMLELVLDLAERCKSISDQELHEYLVFSGVDKDAVGSAERREVWKSYEQAVVNRLVVAFERVKTDDLIELFLRIEVTVERRRDKQPLPIIKALLSVYKQHALDTLRGESDTAGRLISAIRTNSSEEHDLSIAMVGALEALVGNWRRVAMPLGGVIADREVATLRRELNGELEAVAEHLADKCNEQGLSARASRLALDLL